MDSKKKIKLLEEKLQKTTILFEKCQEDYLMMFKQAQYFYYELQKERRKNESKK